MEDAKIQEGSKGKSVNASMQYLHEETEATQIDAKDAGVVTVASTTQIERVKESCRIHRPTALQTFRDFIGKIVFCLKDGVLWQYKEYWEEENEEIYKTGKYDNESEFIIEQKIIKAKDIIMGDNSIDESNYPWHGYTFQEFKELNDEMQATIDTVMSIKNKEDIRRFRRAHKRVYYAYYMTPICVHMDDNGRILFGRDGSHRIHVASIANGRIPVWITKYKETKTISIDYFKTNYAYGEWRFLNDIE